MKNNGVSRASADELNQLVQHDIEKNLWLICNYESNKDIFLNYDGKAAIKMLNMFIFAIDVGLCKDVNTKVHWNKNKELKSILENIGKRRSVLGHNQSADNGNEEDREWYEKWMRNIIGADFPDNENHWRKVYEALEKEEEKLIDLLTEFVKCVARLDISKKLSVVLDWKECIRNWYDHDAGEKAIIGQWKKLYIAKNPKKTVSKPFTQLNSYVKDEVFKSEDEIENYIIGNDSIARAMKERLKVIREKKKTSIKDELGQKDQRLKISEDNMYAEWYINRIREKLHEYCIGSVPSDVGSLLPQDVIQYICSYNNEEILLIDDQFNKECGQKSSQPSGDVESSQKNYMVGTLQGNEELVGTTCKFVVEKITHKGGVRGIICGSDVYACISKNNLQGQRLETGKQYEIKLTRWDENGVCYNAELLIEESV